MRRGKRRFVHGLTGIHSSLGSIGQDIWMRLHHQHSSSTGSVTPPVKNILLELAVFFIVIYIILFIYLFIFLNPEALFRLPLPFVGPQSNKWQTNFRASTASIKIFFNVIQQVCPVACVFRWWSQMPALLFLRLALQAPANLLQFETSQKYPGIAKDLSRSIMVNRPNSWHLFTKENVRSFNKLPRSQAKSVKAMLNNGFDIAVFGASTAQWK